MKKRTVWYLVGVLILALALVTIACARPAEKPAAPAAPTAPVKETPVVPAAPAAPAAPTAPAPAPPTAPAAPAPTPTGPPAIPHTLEGRADCLMCHQTGGLKPYPADHAGRTSATCQACHKPAG